jgi:hypothetical protein
VAAIKVVDLPSAGLALFDESNGFLEAIEAPSEQELRAVIGGKSKSKKKKGSTTIIIVNNIAYYCSCDDPGVIFAPITNVVIP